MENLNVKKREKLKEKRKELIEGIVVLFSKFEYNVALPRVKELIATSKKMFFFNPKFYFYTFVVDSLLLVKCFLRLDKVQLAEETLDQVWKITTKFYDKENMKISEAHAKGLDDLEIKRIDRYISSLSSRNGGVNSETERVTFLLNYNFLLI